ncbi:MAG: F0F1 ATP synthase subunit epsilon [Marinibacterium sp.]
MPDTMQFDLVSPERQLASLQVTAVQLPGAEGDMTALPDHAPLVTALRPGVLTAQGADGESAFLVTGGFAEISADSLSVLAEKAIPVAEMDRQMLDDLIAEARAAHAKAQETAGGPHNIVDEAAKLLADMEGLGDHITV